MANLANCQQFAKLKPSKIVVIIITLWLYLFIHQTSHQTLKKSKFAKVSPHQTFPLYRTIQNFGGRKFWRNNLCQKLADNILANARDYKALHFYAQYETICVPYFYLLNVSPCNFCNAAYIISHVSISRDYRYSITCNVSMT